MKKLRYVFVPVLAAGVILTGVYALVNRKSFTYQNDLMVSKNVPSYITNTDGQLKIIESKEDAKKLIQESNSKFVFYVGRESCGDCEDMRTRVIPLLQNKDIPLYYLDGEDYRLEGKWTKDWYEIVGSYDNELDGYVKNYRFTYTPALNLVINGELVESFWQFGGPGKGLSDVDASRSEYKTRYFRSGTLEQKEQGYINAASDVDKLLNKWKSY